MYVHSWGYVHTSIDFFLLNDSGLAYSTIHQVSTAHLCLVAYLHPMGFVEALGNLSS